MTILLVMHFPLSDLGGVTTFVTELQDGLNDRGHKAFLLVCGSGGNRVAPLAGGRPDTYGIFLRPVYVPHRVLRGVVAFCVYLLPTLYRLWTFLKRERIDVVHIHFPTPYLLYFCVLRPLSPWKLMVTLHGSDIYALPRRTWLFRALLRIVLSGADRVVAATAHLIKAMKEVYPSFRGQTHVIPNGNPLVECEPSAVPATTELPESYVLAVGNLIPRKAHEVLVTAIALARDRGHDLNLVIVGEGAEGPRLRARVRELNVQDLVVFAGRIPHRDVLPFYSNAKFFVHPAREEAQGLVLVEAMTCRKAVIATRVLGIPELVRDGETGLLVEPDDAESLATALIKLDTDKALRDALAERACAYVTNEHAWDRFIARHLETYETVVRGTAGAAAHGAPRAELTASSE